MVVVDVVVDVGEEAIVFGEVDIAATGPVAFVVDGEDGVHSSGAEGPMESRSLSRSMPIFGVVERR